MKRSAAIKACWLGALACIVCLFFLTGCASWNEPRPAIKYPSNHIVVLDKQDLPRDILGTASKVGYICVIRLREYPTCLLHEVRHCLEGNWHEGRESGMDCY